MDKKKKIGLLLLLVFVVVFLYILIFTDLIIDHSIPDWGELDDDQKVFEFEQWLAGGDVYFRPGTDEMTDYLAEMQAIYEAQGLEWPASAVDAALIAANGAVNTSYDPNAPIAVDNRPGTTSVTS